MTNQTPKGGAGGKGGAERRRSARRGILSTFSLFAVVSRKGPNRLIVRDISELGIGFELDIEGENPEAFPVKIGEELELQLYLNQSLSIPLSAKVARIEEGNDRPRIVGAEFVGSAAPGMKAYRAFVQMLDELIDFAKIDR